MSPQVCCWIHLHSFSPVRADSGLGRAQELWMDGSWMLSVLLVGILLLTLNDPVIP